MCVCVRRGWGVFVTSPVLSSHTLKTNYPFSNRGTSTVLKGCRMIKMIQNFFFYLSHNLRQKCLFTSCMN